MARIIIKRLILGVVFAGAFLISISPLVVAQDTNRLISERCTGCHAASRWENENKTEKQWANIVDQMVRYGAQLSEEESVLVVEYLTAKSLGRIKQPTTTTSVAKPKSVTTVASVSKSGIETEGIIETDLLSPTGITTDATTTFTTTVTTITATASGTSISVPGEQAQTGIEVIWYLLGGGMLIAAGMSLRNKDRQLGK
ncbi:MAG: hypothetical protein IBX64_09205 [Actinobacteria bacterium]|nr:hypothetical protein [Actinomycetota bacterium]